MFANLFRKAKETVSDAVRGVEHVDWINHAFPYDLRFSMDMDDAQDLSRPYPPQGFPPEAVQYSETWYANWVQVRDGHMAPVIAIENGDHVGAMTALEMWERQIETAYAAQFELGDFYGGRHLVLANNNVHSSLTAMVEEIRTYIGVRIQGGDASEQAAECIGQVVDIHATMHNAMRGFYHDPQGVAVSQLEAAAYAPIMALRQVNTNSPEFAPIHGVTLHDWVAASAKFHQGTHSIEDICAVLGIERPQWEEALDGWFQRIKEHPMTVGMESSNLLQVPNPKFEGSAGSHQQKNSAAAQRLRTDRNFYVECAAISAAAAELGIDGQAYLQENYGVTVGDVAFAGGAWMLDMRHAQEIHTLISAKQQQFEEKFRRERGVGIADDIEF